MNSRAVLTYLVLYIILNATGLSIALNFWWTDNLNLSFLKKESFLLLTSVGFSWIGILYLSILIIRKFIIKIKTQNFIGPIDLISNEMYQNEIGTKQATKFKNSMTLIAFTILVLTIIVLIKSMNRYEIYELTKYGKVEKIIVKEIRKDMKDNQYIYFYYNSSKNSTNLRNEKNLKLGDEVQVIYSSNNPEIINYKNQ
ncbi:hypothetical protein [Chryseobacterium sp. Leaf394]|uniref:hypothetical protein n=1 Tax=Chryseobacterium sp. Leaf394 TaxID=1736361 RepID=UPI0006FF62BC|nr:hypothetical protein [Chryseobacterium sp. Leaf394]KQS88806.1 hypothetical protein ASG21_16855 [Chryseobacterium sp. Leaf394]